MNQQSQSQSQSQSYYTPQKPQYRPDTVSPLSLSQLPRNGPNPFALKSTPPPSSSSSSSSLSYSQPLPRSNSRNASPAPTHQQPTSGSSKYNDSHDYTDDDVAENSSYNYDHNGMDERHGMQYDDLITPEDMSNRPSHHSMPREEDGEGRGRREREGEGWRRERGEQGEGVRRKERKERSLSKEKKKERKRTEKRGINQRINLQMETLTTAHPPRTHRPANLSTRSLPPAHPLTVAALLLPDSRQDPIYKTRVQPFPKRTAMVTVAAKSVLDILPLVVVN